MRFSLVAAWASRAALIVALCGIGMVGVTSCSEQGLVVTIVSPPDGARFVQGDTIQFLSSAGGGNCSSAVGAPVTFEWSSDLDGRLELGRLDTFPTDSLSLGRHRITLRVECVGDSGDDRITIHVNPQS